MALPLRRRDRTIGALNLFRGPVGGLVPDERQMARVLVSLATIGIINHRNLVSSSPAPAPAALPAPPAVTPREGVPPRR